MTDTPIGTYSWLFGFLNYPYGAGYAASDIYGIRELPSTIQRMSRADLVQVQVNAFGSMAWINVDRSCVALKDIK